MTRNEVYQDLVLYHTKATALEQRAKGEDCPLPDDALMCNVHIYDSVSRYCAGFSNVLEDYHFPTRIKKKRLERVDPHMIEETFFLYLVHRITGSGASFEPGTHGYYNTLIPVLKNEKTIPDMVKVIEAHKGPYISCKGNIPPMFRTKLGTYDKPSREFLCHWAPKLIYHICAWIEKGIADGSKIQIRSLVDEMNRWNREIGQNACHFVYTAFANDVGEYWPEVVDPFSHTNLGSNAIKSLDLAHDGKLKSKDLTRDKVIEWLVEDTGFRPFDLEDSPCCDIQRYWSEYVPVGYGHLTKEQTRNSSFLKQSWGEEKYRTWVNENVQIRNRVASVKEVVEAAPSPIN